MRSALFNYHLRELKRFLACLVRFPLHFICQLPSFIRTLKILGSEESSICIIGGGDIASETIKSLDRSKVRLMALNRYALSDIASEYAPTYYIIVDPHFFNLNDENNIKILTYIAANSIILFIPYRVNSLFLKYVNAIGIRHFGIETRFSRWLGFQSPLLPRSTSGMTILLALQLCLKLSKKNIYLAGFQSNIFKFIEVGFDNKLFLKYPSFGSINSKTLNIDMAAFFLSQYYYFEDIRRISQKFYSRIFIIGDSYIDKFKKIESERDYFE